MTLFRRRVAPCNNGFLVDKTSEHFMKSYTAVIERCPDTGLYVGYVPGFPGAHSQGKTLDELNQNLREVIAMLLEDGEPKMEADFVGTQTVSVS
jgi:predicted RNase H-like HicB family nuclease